MLTNFILWCLFAFAAVVYCGFGIFIIVTLAWYQDALAKGYIPDECMQIERIILLSIGCHLKSKEEQKQLGVTIWHKLFYLFIVLLYLPIILLDKVIDFISWIKRRINKK